MTVIIVDTNIVFSALLNSDGKVGEVLLNNGDQFDFYTSDYLRLEINRYREKLFAATQKVSKENFDEAYFQVVNQIKFISDQQIPFRYWHEAAVLVRDIDKDDLPFVALNLYLEGHLWTGDKKLLQGLLAKGYKNCVSTETLYEQISHKK